VYCCIERERERERERENYHHLATFIEIFETSIAELNILLLHFSIT